MRLTKPPSFDLAVADVPPGTEQWELNIPVAITKAGTHSSRREGRDRNSHERRRLALENPPLSQAKEFLEQVGRDNTKAAIGFAERRVKDVIARQPSQQWVIEHKLDGSLATSPLARAVLYSIRTGQRRDLLRPDPHSRICTTTPVLTSRKLMPYPDLEEPSVRSNSTIPMASAAWLAS